MLLEKLLNNLQVEASALALCRVSDGWRLRLPGLGRVALHYALEGEGRLATTAGDIPLRAGHLVLVPARTRHALEHAGKVENEEVVLEDASTNEPQLLHLVAGESGEQPLRVACGTLQARYGSSLGLFDQLRDPLLVDLSHSPAAERVFALLLEEVDNAAPGSEAMVSTLMTQCMVLCFRTLCQQSNCQLPWLSALEDERLARVLDVVVGDPGGDHTVERLANIAGMSRSSFAEHFTALFGRSVMDFVREVRLRESARLLQTTDRSIDDIAGKVGFSSRSHFSGVFRDHFGVTPTNYRKAE
jgi:AraC-like DNA-binding protein